jgi:hypothetical protein
VICTTPVDLTALVLSDKSKVEWADVPDALGYKVRYRATGDSIWLVKYARGKEFTILKSLDCNTEYEWQVLSICAEDGSSHSVYSASAYFTTAACRLGNAPDGFELSVYPNPAIGDVNIILNGIQGDATLIIYDMTGHVVFENRISGNEQYRLTWDTEYLSNGIYQVVVIMESGQYNQKIMINN